jgi:hypothetical protein
MAFKASQCPDGDSNPNRCSDPGTHSTSALGCAEIPPGRFVRALRESCFSIRSGLPAHGTCDRRGCRTRDRVGGAADRFVVDTCG